MEKIIVCADWHIGRHLYGEIDSTTGLHSADVELLSSVDQLIKYAVDNSITKVIVAGDIFHKRNPSAMDWSVFCRIVEKFTHTLIQLFLISGNHDDSSQFTTALSPVHKFDAVLVDITTQGERRISWAGKKIVLVPYISKRWTDSTVTEYLKDMEADILICHEAITGALYNSLAIHHVEQGGVSPVFLSKKFKLTIAGHFHAAQQVKDNVYYAGPLTHLDFNDYQTEPGFLVIGEDLSVEHTPVKTRKFIQEDWQGFLKLGDNKFDKNDVFKFNIVLEDNTKKHEVKAALDKWQGAFPNTSYIIHEVSKKILRNSNITFDKGPEDHLVEYAKDYKWDKETIQLGQNILESLR